MTLDTITMIIGLLFLGFTAGYVFGRRVESHIASQVIHRYFTTDEINLAKHRMWDEWKQGMS